MTDSEKLAMVYSHIDSEMERLTRFIYNHEANVDQPDYDQQMDYAMALGQRRALMELSHKLMGLAKPKGDWLTEMLEGIKQENSRKP